MLTGRAKRTISTKVFFIYNTVLVSTCKNKKDGFKKPSFSGFYLLKLGLKIPGHKTVFEHLVNVITFGQEDENNIGDIENRGPDHGAPQTGFFMFHVHKGPGDIIGFYHG